MESGLTPREIQARIRAGESVAEVAQAAGVPVDRIEVYAGPVIAEREYATVLAKEAQVRRRGEVAAQRHLGEVVSDALAILGVEPEQATWDAWRGEDRRWTVQVKWTAETDEQQQAHFEFDQRARFSTAIDAAARDLIDDHPTPARPPADPDSEPTVDLNDELAIVRVLQDDTEPPAVVPDAPSARIIKLPGRQAAPDELDDNEPSDYSEPELEQVDGVYDIIPNPQSDMDVLYDMLAGFNEDSVRIYTGLTQPVAPVPAPEPDQAPPAAEQAPPPAQAPPARPARKPRQARSKPAPQREPEPETPQTAPEPERPAPEKPATGPRAEPTPTEPDRSQVQQDALVEQDEPAPKPAPKARRRKRASVPTWDEIMFGGPQPPK